MKPSWLEAGPQRREQHQRAVTEHVGLAEIDAAGGGELGDTSEFVEQVTTERSVRAHASDQFSSGRDRHAIAGAGHLPDPQGRQPAEVSSQRKNEAPSTPGTHTRTKGRPTLACPEPPPAWRESRSIMDLKFHHMNLCSDNLPRLSHFYRTIFDLGAINDGRTRVNDQSAEVGYSGKVDFVGDGTVEFHLAERDLLTGFKMKQFINPMDRGHFCFRTDDIFGFKRRLDELGIRYSDYGIWAVAGWYQIFLHDPDGNIVEVHQPNVEL